MRIRSACGLLMLVVVAACASMGGGDARRLEEALYAYKGAIRWGDLEGAAAFIDPEVRESKQPSALERERAAQLQVTGYYVQGSEEIAPDQIRQIVEIRLVNRHTQVERNVIDRQLWRWDRKAKRWWLTSGLPDFAPK